MFCHFSNCQNNLSFDSNAMLNKMRLLENLSNNLKVLNFMKIKSSHLLLSYQGNQAYIYGPPFYQLVFEHI